MTNVLQIKAVTKKTTLGCAEVLYRGRKHDDDFPTPITLSAGYYPLGWLEHEVDEWIENRPRIWKGPDGKSIRLNPKATEF
jgi:predicted DNA-binding transcriptional regulator AlpA